jgi:chemotaxis protein MotB
MAVACFKNSDQLSVKNTKMKCQVVLERKRCMGEYLMRKIWKNFDWKAFKAVVFVLIPFFAFHGLQSCVSKESKSEVRPMTPMSTKGQHSQALTGVYEQLIKRLQPEIKSKKVEVKKFENQVRIAIPNDILFPGGGWTVDRKGYEILDKIVPVMKEYKHSPIEIYGYTDNGPLGHSLRSKFSTNRELSLTRAVDIVNYFQKKGVNGDMLSATGYGSEQPVATNDTAQGRSRNRRMEIAIMVGES